ncbi:MAG: nitroreductase family protein [Prevotellaceae bacterium]|jgi:nitroreductase|nr:nitroreductase family protein [Prevotellaceae bacterium]
MKKINIYQITTLLLAVAFIALSYSRVGTKTEAKMDTKAAVLENIHSRKSVRKYTEKSVSREDLLTLVKAGMAAPSAKNVQPWEFIIVSEKAALNAMAAQLPYAKMLEQAPAAIVPCGNLDFAPTDTKLPFLWYLDCAMASQNILLAAEAMGLGAVYTAAYPYEDRMSAVTSALSLPQNIVPLCVIPVGYPAGNEQPKDKWKEEKVRWEKW